MMPARGWALLETLVALALLGVAVSALLSLQWQARGLQRAAWQHQHALFLLDELATRMRSNPEGRAIYLRQLSLPMPSPGALTTCVTAACTPAARAEADIQLLALSARRQLMTPAWALQPCVTAAGDCLLLAWQGTRPEDGPSGDCLDEAGETRPGARCLVLELP